MRLLDTDTCVTMIRGRSERLTERLREHPPTEVAISSVTLGELHYGVQRSEQRERNAEALTRFLAPLEVLPFGRPWSGTARRSGPST